MTRDEHGNALEPLGKIIVQEVRDYTITQLDGIIAGQYKGAFAQHIRQTISELGHDPQALLHTLFPDIVDNTLTVLLQVLDAQVGSVVIEVMEGEEWVSPYAYTGALGTLYDTEDEDGWIAMYSQQRRTALTSPSSHPSADPGSEL